MSNSYSYQVLKDDTQHAVIKLTASFDGSSQEDAIARIAANTLYGALATNGFPVANVYGGAANTTLPYYGLTINRVWFDTPSITSSVELYWRANNDVGVSATTGTPLLFLHGNGEYDGNGNWITIKNPSVTANTNGDISVCTRGQVANTGYTLILELRKDNEHYQRGQFNDPAAFNFGPKFSLRP
jgi:hypothetical protein